MNFTNVTLSFLIVASASSCSMLTRKPSSEDKLREGTCGYLENGVAFEKGLPVLNSYGVEDEERYRNVDSYTIVRISDQEVLIQEKMGKYEKYAQVKVKADCAGNISTSLYTDPQPTKEKATGTQCHMRVNASSLAQAEGRLGGHLTLNSAGYSCEVFSNRDRKAGMIMTILKDGVALSTVEQQLLDLDYTYTIVKARDSAKDASIECVCSLRK